MDEISQDPKLNFGDRRGRWIDVAVAVVLVAAVVIALMTGLGRAGPRRAGPAAAPAVLPATVTTRIPMPSGQPGDMTIVGSTAWISDWSASQITAVDLTAGRVTRTVRVGDWQNQPVSMTSGAGSLWVLDFAGPLLRIDPASGAVTRRFPVRGLGADVAYGGGFIWMLTGEPGADGDYLYKIDPDRDVIVTAAPVPAAGLACAASPGPQGIWIGCADVDRIILISPDSLTPVRSVRVDSGGYIPQIVPGPHRRPGRLWITGSLLTVALPGTSTAYPVADTPDLISAAADGPAIWFRTRTGLARLQLSTPGTS